MVLTTHPHLLPSLTKECSYTSTPLLGLIAFSTVNVTFFNTTQLHIRKPVILIANYPDRLGPSGNFVDNSIELMGLEITSYRIKHSTVLWLLELQIRRGRKFQTQVHTVNCNSRNSHCQCRLFSKKNTIIRIFVHIRITRRPSNPGN